MKIIVERATQKELAEIAFLFNRYRMFYGQMSDIDRSSRFIADRLLENSSVIFYAKNLQNNQVIGFSQLYPIFSSVSLSKQMLLNDLFVNDEFRGLGVGKKLLDAAKKYAMTHGNNALALSTEKTNTGAQKLYESLGYKKDLAFLNYTLSLTND